MIPPPGRSVTRFFIPLIDVMTLLFCIFLLMPYAKPEQDDPRLPAGAEDPAVLSRDVAALTRERDRLLRDREQAVWKQAVRVLEIDSDTGKLFERGPGRPEIASQADAFACIDRARREAGGRDVYYLLLYPRELSGYPSQRQVTAYRRWFASVPHGFDNPHMMPVRGTP